MPDVVERYRLVRPVPAGAVCGSCGFAHWTPSDQTACCQACGYCMARIGRGPWDGLIAVPIDS